MKNVSFKINIVDKISAGLKNIKGGFEKVAKAAVAFQSHIFDMILSASINGDPLLDGLYLGLLYCTLTKKKTT